MTTTPFTCWLCGRQLGRDAPHYIVDGGSSSEVVCGKCVHGNARGTLTKVPGRAHAAHLLRNDDEQRKEGRG